MPHSPSGASARPSPHVLIKSLELSALHTSRIRDMVRLNGNRSKAAIETLRTETEAASKKIEDDRAAADAEIQRKRTQLDVDAAAVKQRADATDARSAELDKLAQTLAAREAELIRRQSAFREHADAISSLKA